MDQVSLSRRAIAGSVAEWMGSPGFPEQLYVSLESCVGFGEGCGGVAVGSVIDAVTDLESGFFVSMVSIDQLVLNIPDEAELAAFFGASWDGAGPGRWTAQHRHRLSREYEWVFAEEVNGTRIRWE